MAKPKRERFSSPKGIAKYPRLQKPDTKFDSDGVFKLDLILDRSIKADAAFIAELETKAKKAFTEAKADLKANKKVKLLKELTMGLPFEEVLDDEGDETGKVAVKFKLSAHVKPKNGDAFDQKPALFDSKGKPYVGPTIGGGSTVRVSFEVIEYCNTAAKNAGISLRLKAVKVIDLVEYVPGGDASAYGFDDEEDEGGYESDESSSDFEEEEDEGTEEGDDDDF